MIKRIKQQNFLTTPFVAAKGWELSNVDNQDSIILDDGSFLALDYVDYTGVTPEINSDSSIASGNQLTDIAVYQEGVSGSGLFYPGSEPQNQDGTYKRLVYTQTKAAFYNTRNNPTQIFGVDYIDFPLGQTVRNLADNFRMFTVPSSVFGDRIRENTVVLTDTTLDDNVTITDDGYQNLVAGSNLFSKIQEVRPLGNVVIDSDSGIHCFNLPIAPVLTGSMTKNTPNTASLQWTTASYSVQDSFEIDRSSDSYTFSLLTTIGKSTGSFYDLTAKGGNTYWYKIYAISNTYGYSPESNTVTIVVPPGQGAPADQQPQT